MAPAPRIAPSILSADFARLGEEVRMVADAGAQVIHIDVMDGHFVPPLSMGPQVVSAVRELELGVMLDVHLMVERPERHIADFAKAGADTITFHVEATPHVNYVVQHIRSAGCTAGLAINPATPLGVFAEIEVDHVLCMSVNPGWGGQAFIPSSLDKIRRLRSLVGDGPEIAVDGGIDEDTAGPCADAGATLFVAGSAIFGREDPVRALQMIASAAGCSQPH